MQEHHCALWLRVLGILHIYVVYHVKCAIAHHFEGSVVHYGLPLAKTTLPAVQAITTLDFITYPGHWCLPAIYRWYRVGSLGDLSRCDVLLHCLKSRLVFSLYYLFGFFLVRPKSHLPFQPLILDRVALWLPQPACSQAVLTPPLLKPVLDKICRCKNVCLGVVFL